MTILYRPNGQNDLTAAVGIAEGTPPQSITIPSGIWQFGRIKWMDGPITVEAEPVTDNQYYTSFDEFAPGLIPQSGPWRHAYELDSMWEFVDIGGGDIVLRQRTLHASDTGLAADVFETPYTDCEIYAVGTTTINNTSSLELIIGYNENIATKPSYRIDYNVSTGAIRLRKRWFDGGPVVSTMFTSGNTAVTGINNPVAFRVRKDGARVRVKVWRYGQPEPEAWLVDWTDNAPIAGPGVPGVYMFGQRITPTWLEYGIGINGNSAPTEPVNVVVPPEEPTGPTNYITNGTFETLNDWQFYSQDANWVLTEDPAVGSVVNNQLRITASTGKRYPRGVTIIGGLNPGQYYKITVDHTESSGAGFELDVWDNALPAGQTGTSRVRVQPWGTGLHEVVFQATQQTHHLSLVAGVDSSGYNQFDNVTVVETEAPAVVDRYDTINNLMFTGDSTGVVTIFDDMSIMFQDIAGTVPVTAVGQPIGRVLDKSPFENHWVAVTEADRPILHSDGNGVLCLNCAGGKYLVNMNNIQTAGHPYMTAMTKMYIPVLGGYKSALALGMRDDEVGAWDLGLTDSYVRFLFRSADGQSINRRSNNNANPATRLITGMLRFNTTSTQDSMDIRLNGAPAPDMTNGSATNPTPAGQGATKKVSIGTRIVWGTSTNPADVRVYSVGIFSSATEKTLADIQAVENIFQGT